MPCSLGSVTFSLRLDPCGGCGASLPYVSLEEFDCHYCGELASPAERCTNLLWHRVALDVLDVLADYSGELRLSAKAACSCPTCGAEIAGRVGTSIEREHCRAHAVPRVPAFASPPASCWSSPRCDGEACAGACGRNVSGPIGIEMPFVGPRVIAPRHEEATLEAIGVEAIGVEAITHVQPAAASSLAWDAELPLGTPSIGQAVHRIYCVVGIGAIVAAVLVDLLPWLF